MSMILANLANHQYNMILANLANHQYNENILIIVIHQSRKICFGPEKERLRRLCLSATMT